MVTCALPSLADDDPALVVLYNGLGTPARAELWGRVLEDPGELKPGRNEGRWAKLKRNVKALESDEIDGARLTLTVAGETATVTSDDEGLFSATFRGLAPGAHPVKVTLHDQRRLRVEPGWVLVFPKKPGVAVISDIDDTVLDTGVTSKRKLVARALYKNVHDLKTFNGAPALYQAWAARGYPLVFISGSPINFYTQLSRFFALRAFPRAPLLLKNMGLGRDADPLTEQKAYKLRQIARARRLLPGYALLLLGDAGEADPAIYRAVAAKDPGAVKAMMIRKVAGRCPSNTKKDGLICFAGYPELARVLGKRELLSAEEVARVAAKSPERSRQGKKRGKIPKKNENAPKKPVSEARK